MTFQTNRIQLVSDKYYEATFSNALVVTILGTVHAFGRKPDVAIYQMDGTESRANVNVNLTNFDVTVTFNQQRSGIIILT
jgi:hypothetical protein